MASKLNAFCQLIREEGQVDLEGLEEQVRRAYALVFLFDRTDLIGTAAIKQPRLDYKRRVFEMGAVPEMEEAYSFELGYVVVAKSHRNRKLSRQLVDAAIESVPDVPLFATSRSDRVAMHRTLERYNFRRVGQTYQSIEQGAEVLLFVRDVAQQALGVDAASLRSRRA
jgi:predicted GNAT family N-acyltransferase